MIPQRTLDALDRYVNEGTPGLSQIDTNSGALKKINWFGGYEGMHPTDFAFLSNGVRVTPVVNRRPSA